MTGRSDAVARDRSWHRPGRARYALGRIRQLIHPAVEVSTPAPGSVVIDHDVAVTTRDGTVLRVNVYRPPGDTPVPVVLCAHPYGKDRLPQQARGGRWKVSFQFRVLRQTDTLRFSSLTGWEAPDPAWWVEQGYAVVNADLRGCGTSDGVGSLLSLQEGEDIHDIVEWAAAQAWSTGAVGMLGVSYLALSQWRTAATRPPSLRAIVPWEGFTDVYRDLAFPGGVPEVGFLALWSRGTRSARERYSLLDEGRARPLRDEWWQALVPDLAAIDVPALVCGSFSDNNLHSRGSFRGFDEIASAERHLHTHRTGKWAAFYSDEGRRVQKQFLDRHLRGLDVAPLPTVRLEVRERADVVAGVRDESQWPLARTHWTAHYLSGRGLVGDLPSSEGSAAFAVRGGGLSFGWTVPEDTEVTGPAALRMHVSLEGTDDADLVVGLEKWADGRYVPFEGSYGFGRDRVTTGWQRVSLRALDADQSRPYLPVPSCATSQPLAPGEIVPVDIALGPSATLFRAGEQLRLVVAARWLWPRNPLTGQFPARYATLRRGRVRVHSGPEHLSYLLLPVVPTA